MKEDAAAAALVVPIPYAPATLSQQEQVRGAQDVPVPILRRRLPFTLSSVKRQKVRKYACICSFFVVFVLFLLLTVFLASLQYTEQLRLPFSGPSKGKRGHSTIWWEKLLTSNRTTSRTGLPVDHKHCNNTEQGSKWVTDSKGVMCPRESVLETGCCDPEGQGSVKFYCGGCVDTGGSNCCELYEGCVSCCMSPEHLSDLNKYVESVVGGKSAAGPGASGTSGGAANVAAGVVVTEENKFFVCGALCRTSSKSIVRQRFYKSVTHKYCYN